MAKVQLTIDGKAVEAEEGAMLLQVARIYKGTTS